MRWLALLGVVGWVACTRANPSYGDGDSTGRLDDEGQGSFDGSPTDASISASDDALTDSADDSPHDEDASASDPTVDSGGSKPCCESHGGHGCEDQGVEDCVCGMQPQCCLDEWAENCVRKATVCGAGCPTTDTGVVDEGGTTESSGTTTGTTDGTTDDGSPTTSGGSTTGAAVDACCVAAEVPGCNDADVETCVCALGPTAYCCKDVWDAQCVEAAMNSCVVNCAVADG